MFFHPIYSLELSGDKLNLYDSYYKVKELMSQLLHIARTQRCDDCPRR